MAESLPTYLTVAAADELAAQVSVPLYSAASEQDKLAALILATARIDSIRWQGAKYDVEQPLQFPRIVDGPAVRIGNAAGYGVYGYPTFGPGTVWDWDSATNQPIVPQVVKLACLYEANDILDGRRDEVRKAIDAGITGESAGGMSTQYRAAFAGQASPDALCTEAAGLLRRFKLKTGRLL